MVNTRSRNVDGAAEAGNRNDFDLDLTKCPECLNPYSSNAESESAPFHAVLCQHVKCLSCLLKDPKICGQCELMKKPEACAPVTAAAAAGPAPAPTPKLRKSTRMNNSIGGGAAAMPMPTAVAAQVEDVEGGTSGSTSTMAAQGQDPGQGSTSANPSKPKPKNSLTKKPKRKRTSGRFVIPHFINQTNVNGMTLYNCTICRGKKFKTKAHIKYHLPCKSGKWPFNCRKCKKGFGVKSHYQYDQRVHSGRKPYACQECGKRFRQRSKVTRHMRSHRRQKPFIRKQCGRGFAAAEDSSAHSGIGIHSLDRPFGCEECNKAFKGMAYLKKHRLIHDITGERPFKCDVCHTRFARKWELNVHMVNHSTEMETERERPRPYKCRFALCSKKTFTTYQYLKRHEITHKDERPFTCKLCKRSFHRKDNLVRHLRNVHKQLPEMARVMANQAANEYFEAQALQQRKNMNSNQQIPPNSALGKNPEPEPMAQVQMQGTGSALQEKTVPVAVAHCSKSCIPTYTRYGNNKEAGKENSAQLKDKCQKDTDSETDSDSDSDSE